MTVVAVTGASGHLARLLVGRLDTRADVDRVVGVDVAEPGYQARNLEFYRLDVRSPSVADVISGCDVLVHLATASRGSEGPDVVVAGTRNVLEAAAAAQVGKVVFRSGVHVYGAHPDNDFPLTEESPLRPVHELAESVCLAEAEEIVAAFRESHPKVTVTVLRPCPTLGPGSSGAIAQMVAAPFVLRVDGYDPPLGLVHPVDVARAFEFAIDRNLDGDYNVCPADRVTLGELTGSLGKREVSCAHGQAQMRAARLGKLGLVDLAPEAVPFVMYPWAASGDKLRAEGFEFRHDVAETVQEAASAKGWMSVGAVRFRPRVAVAAAGAVALAGGLVRRRARRHRTAARRP